MSSPTRTSATPAPPPPPHPRPHLRHPRVPTSSTPALPPPSYPRLPRVSRREQHPAPTSATPAPPPPPHPRPTSVIPALAAGISTRTAPPLHPTSFLAIPPFFSSSSPPPSGARPRLEQGNRPRAVRRLPSEGRCGKAAFDHPLLHHQSLPMPVPARQRTMRRPAPVRNCYLSTVKLCRRNRTRIMRLSCCPPPARSRLITLLQS